VDLDENRLDLAKQVGATHCVNSGAADWAEQVRALTDGHGVDVAVEAVGLPATFDMCTRMVRPGGNVANVGVHGKPVQLALQELWIKNITISMGLVNTTTLGMLLKLVTQRKLPVEAFITHRFDLAHILDAYETFENATETHALKVLISR
jgi:alcohol dehydrogenase